MSKKKKPQTFTLEDVKLYAWYAVQHASKLIKKDERNVITKYEMDKYIESEIYPD